MSTTTPKTVPSGCEFSPCGAYRYTLWRRWTPALIAPAHGYVQFIGLNPSTADDTKDDPTIRRCVEFAKAWGFSALCMTNLFAFRATDPTEMRKQYDPVGPLNDKWLIEIAKSARLIVAAWGVHGIHMDRGKAVQGLFGKHLHYLRLTKAGHPEHPLYLPSLTVPTPFL